jgi:sterol desaturase/sphingolipid hydroxylase (fatty acid hydroxylase superfamily)
MIPALIMGVFVILLNKKTSLILAFINVYLISAYVYFIHRIFHYIPEKYNLHKNFHHNVENNKNSIFNRIINLIIETLLNIGFFVLLYSIKILFNLKFLSNIFIFFIGILYVSVHIVNYSIFNISKTHVNHHIADNSNKEDCNFGPDIFDHIFNTSCDGSYENLTHTIPNIIFAYVLTCSYFKKKYFN